MEVNPETATRGVVRRLVIIVLVVVTGVTGAIPNPAGSVSPRQPRVTSGATPSTSPAPSPDGSATESPLPSPSPSLPPGTGTPTPIAPTPIAPTSGPSLGPLEQPLYVRQTSAARLAYDATQDPTERRLLWQIAGTPTPQWMGGGGDDDLGVDRLETAAAAQNQTPQLVLYAIPQRDCGGLAAGGLASVDEYTRWIDSLRAAINGRPTVVIIEPDAIDMSCLTSTQQEQRQIMMTYAARTLSADPMTWVYIHAGSGSSIGYIAPMLAKVGIAYTRGFALNVADFQTTEKMTAYGHRLNAALEVEKPFVIDTSRNGAGPIGARMNNGAPYWCNPPGRAVGRRPTVLTDDRQVDAYLWIKPPGESDGVCHPGDPTGWHKPFALALADQAIKRGTIAELAEN